MSRQIGYPLAVQRAALRDLASDGDPHLAFETGSAWQHLSHYLALAENLPAGPDQPLNLAAQAASGEAARFGTPSQLRAQLTDDPGLLARPSQPPIFYDGLVWLVMQLRRAAVGMLSLQESLLAAGVPGSDRREGLQALGQEAEQARTPIAPLLQAAAGLKKNMLATNAALALAAAASASQLQVRQEALGGLEATIDALEREIAHLGLFGAHKKSALETQLHTLRAQLAQDAALAEDLRQQLDAVNRLLAHGAWLEAAIDELLEWLDGLRAAWSALGSGVTQLAADASDASLDDDNWLANKLDSNNALPAWRSLAVAAQGFAQRALVDFPLPPSGVKYKR